MIKFCNTDIVLLKFKPILAEFKLISAFKYISEFKVQPFFLNTPEFFKSKIFDMLRNPINP